MKLIDVSLSLWLFELALELETWDINVVIK